MCPGQIVLTCELQIDGFVFCLSFGSCFFFIGSRLFGADSFFCVCFFFVLAGLVSVFFV